MTHRSTFVVCGFAAATILASATLSMGGEAKRGKAALLRPAFAPVTSPEVFTVRYVCFVAKPHKSEVLTTEEALKREADLPAILDELQNGSKISMETTPEAFLGGLRGAQADHGFRLLLSGTATCIGGSDQPAVLNDGPDPMDPLRISLHDRITVSRNSPVMVTIHQTGKFSHRIPEGQDTEGWTDMHADNIVIGRTYSQGINNDMDGSRFVYTFCILPGRLDQTASAWSRAVKVFAAHKAIAHTKTATR